MKVSININSKLFISRSHALSRNARRQQTCCKTMIDSILRLVLLLTMLTDLLEPHRYSRRRKSEGSIDLENLSYALDSYGRPVLCESDITAGSLSSRPYSRTKNRDLTSKGLKGFISELHFEDNLTREEKAAKIRAEIARRREQLLNSEMEARMAEAHAEESRLARDVNDTGYYDADGYPIEDRRYADDIGYDDPMLYDPGVVHPGALGRMRRRRLQGPPMSRSLDAAYDDYYDDLVYEDDLYYNSLRERGEYYLCDEKKLIDGLLSNRNDGL